MKITSAITICLLVALAATNDCLSTVVVDLTNYDARVYNQPVLLVTGQHLKVILPIREH